MAGFLLSPGPSGRRRRHPDRLGRRIARRCSSASIKALYLKEHPGAGDCLELWASSGILQVQIQRGAPVDVFASAGTAPMRDLAAEGPGRQRRGAGLRP